MRQTVGLVSFFGSGLMGEMVEKVIAEIGSEVGDKHPTGC